MPQVNDVSWIYVSTLLTFVLLLTLSLTYTYFHFLKLDKSHVKLFSFVVMK